MKRKDFYTTSEVAKILHVAVGSVINWVNNKQIKAIVTPGGHRKISNNDLLDFLKELNYVIPSFLIEKKLVYIVDDDETIHSFFREIFSHIEGFDIKVFSSGTEALLAIGKDLPEIIVVDILMPDVDGIKVIQNIRNHEQLKEMQIIAISGDTTKKTVSIESGANIFIKKPIEIDDFRKSLHKLFE